MPEFIEIPDPNIYQAYGLYFIKSKHSLIQRLKRHFEPTVHGYRTWQSSFLLIDYLEHNPPRKRARVMDIGCGWSPVGIYCAKNFESRVTGVDVDPNVFPYLNLLARLNDVEVENWKTRFERITTARLGEEYLVMGSDICFWDELVKPLYNFIARALKGGVKRVLIADPGRPTFYELVDLCNAKWNAELTRWYALEPKRFTGEILSVRPVRKR